MRLNLFKSGNWPSDDFQRDLVGLAEIPNADLAAIGTWLRESDRYYELDLQTSQSLGATSALHLRDLEQHIGLTTYVLRLMLQEGLGSQELAADFKELGLSEPQRARLTTYFGGLSDIAEKLNNNSLTRFAEEAGLPTLDDCNFVCDLRPVFGSPAYEGRPMGTRHTEIVGVTTVVLFEIVATGADEQPQRLTIQLSERDLEMLAEAIDRAKAQVVAANALKRSLR